MICSFIFLMILLFAGSKGGADQSQRMMNLNEKDYLTPDGLCCTTQVTACFDTLKKKITAIISTEDIARFAECERSSSRGHACSFFVSSNVWKSPHRSGGQFCKWMTTLRSGLRISVKKSFGDDRRSRRKFQGNCVYVILEWSTLLSKPIYSCSNIYTFSPLVFSVSLKTYLESFGIEMIGYYGTTKQS